MKIGIFYFSATGITRTMAEIAGKIIKDYTEVDVIDIREIDMNCKMNYHFYIIGSYCDSNQYPKEVLAFFEKLKNKKKKLASFVTHATYEEGVYYDNWAKGCEDFFYRFCEENKAESSAYFHCRAKPSKPVAFFIKNTVLNNLKEWHDYKKDMDEYPREVELNRFYGFIKKIIEDAGLS